MDRAQAMVVGYNIYSCSTVGEISCYQVARAYTIYQGNPRMRFKRIIEENSDENFLLLPLLTIVLPLCF